MHAAEVKLNDVGKRYGELWAVRHVNLHIHRGQFFTFLGPSGCGKTTLLRTIAGFVAPDEGAVYLDSREVTTVPPWKRDVGMVFQNYALWPHMTVFENVAFGLRERRLSRAEIERRVMAGLRQVDLQGTERRRPSQLSGGQQQRVALARTLVVQPRVLLLDEPLSNLDAQLRIEMRIELLKLQRDLGLTTIYVTHDQEEALALSTRIAVMSYGQIIQEGTPREIYEQPGNEFVAAFVGQSNLFAGTVQQISDSAVEVRTEDGLVIRVLPKGFPAAPSQGDRILLSLRPEAIELRPLDSACSGMNNMRGQVAASAYQGPSVEYEIHVLTRAIKIHALNPKGKRLFQRGDEVQIAFAPEDVGVVAAAR